MSSHKTSFDTHDLPPGHEAGVPAALPFAAIAGTLIIVASVFTVYFPSLNGRFVLDDDVLLTKSELVNAADGLHRIWCSQESMDFWPGTNTSFWLEWRLWRMHPAGYHVTNLILHVAEALLIWLILRKLAVPGAFLAALLFALHPVNVESVAWIASRKNVMAMLFFLLSIFWYLKFLGHVHRPLAAEQTPSPFIPHPSSFCYWLSLAAFLMSMLGKGSVAVLPVLLLAIIWWLRPLTRRDILLTLPFFAIAFVLAIVNMWFQTHGSAEPIRTATITERLLGAGNVIWFYLYKALWPVDLAFVYPQWHITARNILWWLPLSATLVVTAVLWRYRNGWGRALLFAWAFFCVALLPVMGFADVGFMQYSMVADRYQHIALLAIVCLALAAWSTWRMRTRPRLRWLTAGIALAMVPTVAFLSWRQSGIYRDAITLYDATLAKNPNCWMALNNLGGELIDAGRFQDAIARCRQSIKLHPNYAKAYNNVGIALAKMGRPEEAIPQYRRAIELQPGYPDAHNNLGSALVATGQFQEAMDQCQQALLLNPHSVEARVNLGNAYRSAGRYQQAIEQYTAAISLDPESFQSYVNMGSALSKTGAVRDAIEYYEKALRLNPLSFETHNNLGNALQSVGQYQQAIEHYKTTLDLSPKFSLGHFNLGTALAKTNRLPEAIEHYRQALALDPNFTSAYLYLAMVYAADHQSSQALDAAQKGMELARSKGDAELAGRFENWLNSYRPAPADR